MKTKLLFILFAVINISASASGRLCVLDEANPTLSALAEEVGADCSWSIDDVVEESILEQCRDAEKSAGVQFRNSSQDELRFSEFSYTYDVNKAYYYCKNKAGYEAYFSQSASYLREEVRVNANLRNRANRSTSRSHGLRYEVKEEKVVLWKCIIPTYIPIPRTYTAEEKEVLDFTYGRDHRYACAKVK